MLRERGKLEILPVFLEVVPDDDQMPGTIAAFNEVKAFRQVLIDEQKAVFQGLLLR